MGEGQSEDLVGRIASLNLGPYKLQRPLVALSQDTAGSLTMPAIGVNLGGNILRRFTVIIDYPGKTLILEPNSHLAETFAADASGLILKASGDDLRTFTIQDIVPDSPATASGLQQGDILRTIDGDPANKFVLWQLQDRLKDSGDVLKLEVQRNSKTVTCELRLHSLV
jgi:membrane-associated protease RseP (regulator of RpoE activity)